MIVLITSLVTHLPSRIYSPVGTVLTFHPYEDVLLREITSLNEKMNLLKLNFIDNNTESILKASGYSHIELSPDGSLLLLYSTRKIGY